ncbi:C39 family peptidase [Nonomuraea diastatica]|uniref:Uncharacterized protein n=1 Tax=Nonomuraea diastatica TaxID=1848329 RepID=A0A4R4WT15_9ACTN|nr:C39 family peptidase [Nonomuraea diastatica]TDD20726.1 hypothetical protein E1294_16895 [Nonomuraea diastatica]
MTGTVAGFAVTVGALCFTSLAPAHASPTAPPPSGTPTPVATSTATAAPKGLLSPLRCVLSLKGQRQQNGYYGVPASSSMSLSTFGIKVSQSTLAKKMKTTSSGTRGNAVAPAQCVRQVQGRQVHGPEERGRQRAGAHEPGLHQRG